MTIVQLLKGVAGNRCPNCGQGAVFRGVYAMNRKCPSCHAVYEKENGYFLGAMVASYFLGAASLAPMLVITLFVMHLEIRTVLIIGVVQTLLLHPLLNRFSRLMWMYVEHRMTKILDKR